MPWKVTSLAFLQDQLTGVDVDDKFQFSQLDTTDRATLTAIVTTYDEYQELLLKAINNLTLHSFLANCQAKIRNAVVSLE